MNDYLRSQIEIVFSKEYWPGGSDVCSALRRIAEMFLFFFCLGAVAEYSVDWVLLDYARAALDEAVGYKFWQLLGSFGLCGIGVLVLVPKSQRVARRATWLLVASSDAGAITLGVAIGTIVAQLVASVDAAATGPELSALFLVLFLTAIYFVMFLVMSVCSYVTDQRIDRFGRLMEALDSRFRIFLGCLMALAPLGLLGIARV